MLAVNLDYRGMDDIASSLWGCIIFFSSLFWTGLRQYFRLTGDSFGDTAGEGDREALFGKDLVTLVFLN